MSVLAANGIPGNKAARPGRMLVFFLCFAALPLWGGQAFCAALHREIHGCWEIDLAAAGPEESLAVYFGARDEEEARAKAASLVLSFDIRRMKFWRALSGKKEAWTIARIEKRQDDTWELWYRGIKFPDYLEALPDDRLRYGSEWGRRWSLILRRKAPGAEKSC